MYKLERKLISKLIFLLSIVAFLVVQASAITLPELRQIVTDTCKSATTAHLVYIRDLNDNSPVVGSINELMDKIMSANKHALTKEDIIMDLETKRVKFFITDLRDIDALLKRFNLPTEQKMSFPKSRTIIIQDIYELELDDSYAPNEPAQAGIIERPGDASRYMSDLLFLGVIDGKLLSQDNNPTLTEARSQQGQPLLNIQLAIERQDANIPPISVKIECEPSLAYRFRHIEWYAGERLVSETIADDYRDVNGIPYPYLYIDRSFDETGKILREEKYVVKDAKFGVDLSAKDFKLFVPDGTVMTDMALGMATYKIEQGGYMGVDDVLSMGMNLAIKQ